MKIGVFGDSYCQAVDYNSAGYSSWFELLGTYGHNVTSYGVGGASVTYAAQQILKHGDEYDFIIWCVTSPSRISVPVDEGPQLLPFTAPDSFDNWEFPFKKFDTLQKIAAVRSWYMWLFDMDTAILTDTALTHYVSSKFANVMILPCFSDPLGEKFNLYSVCEIEMLHYFNNKNIKSIYEKFNDIRRCHFSVENNKILAELIANNLRPGIFDTSYDNFCHTPQAPLETYFRKK